MAAPAAAQALAFSHVYGDGMVLQRAPHAASVWGWAAPGAKVRRRVHHSASTRHLGLHHSTRHLCSLQGNKRNFYGVGPNCET
jgi:hypothetical protein